MAMEPQVWLEKEPFLIIEYIPGRTLNSCIRGMSADRGKFNLTKEKLSIAIQIAKALEYLKGYKLTHRDVKPANIFLFEK